VTPLALGLVLGSAALHATWSVLIKQSRDPVAFNWLQMAPGLLVVGGVLAALPALRGTLAAAGWDFWRWVLAAAICHGLYMLWMGRALAEGDLSLVYPIARSTPAFLPFAAAPLLGERISSGGAIGIVTVVFGMWLVQTRGKLQLAALARPETRFAWLTLLATVGYSITDKGAMVSLDAGDWPSALPRAVFYFLLTTIGGTLAMTPALYAAGDATRRLLECARADGGRALLALVFSGVGYSLILEALRTAPASYVVAVRQTSVLFAVALGALWLRESPGRARVAGACVIVAGVALVGAAG
jgi:drug/metabolite transporter (DMT)-like permease